MSQGILKGVLWVLLKELKDPGIIEKLPGFTEAVPSVDEGSSGIYAGVCRYFLAGVWGP